MVQVCEIIVRAGRECGVCPAHSSSPAASDSITDCACDAGHSGPDGGPCAACPSGTYKDGPGSAACAACPANSEAPAGAGICVCSAGHAGPDGGPCAACASGAYKVGPGNTACQPCPADSQSPSDGTARDHCLCNAGYAGADAGSTGGTCSACAEGSYKHWIGHASKVLADGGSTACLLCHDNHTTLAGAVATASSECQCISGYFSSELTGEGACFECEHGTFREGLGNDQACLRCPAGSTTWTSRTVHEADCIPDAGHTQNGAWTEDGDPPGFPACAPGTFREFEQDHATPCVHCTGQATPGATSPAGSTSAAACACEAPAYLPHGTPLAACRCAAGHSRASAGAACVACAVGYTCAAETTAAPVAPVQCPAGQTTADRASVPGDCECGRGHTGSDCDECAAGQYKGALGPAACTDCGAGATSVAGTKLFADCSCVAVHYGSEGVCTACLANSFSEAGSTVATACVCVAGYEGAAGGACSECAAGTFSGGGGAACAACPANSEAPAGAGTCVCSAGHAGPYGGPCTACAVDTFRDTSSHTNYARACGTNNAEACGTSQSTDYLHPHSYTTHIHDSSFAVDEDTSTKTCTHTLKTNADEDGGQWWKVDLEQDLVVSGLRMRGRGNSLSVKTEGYSVYVLTDDDITSKTDADICVFEQTALPPDRAEDLTCVSPITGRYVFVYLASGEPLTLCDVQVWSKHSDSQACTACSAYSNSPQASTADTACVCNAGFSGPDGGACTACLAGKYKIETGAGDCQTCAPHSHSPAASVAAAACSCNAGWTGPDGGPCTECAEDTFKSVTGSSECAQCTNGAVAPLGSTAEEACECTLGFSGQGVALCSECSAGKFKDSTGAAECTPCPQHASSPASSTVATACACNAGFTGLNGSICVACAAGTHKAGPGPSDCQQCPPNTFSPPASDARTDCTCNAGYAGSNGGLCEACEAGWYKNEPGASACQACPQGSHSPTASNTSYACKCNVGFAGANGMSCVACAEDTYKDIPGPTACKPCAAHAVSGRGSEHAGECLCKTGYAGGTAGGCSACPINTFGMISVCQACAAGSSSPALSGSESNCTCNAGYFRSDSPTAAARLANCSICPADSFSNTSEAAACTACPAFSSAPAGSTHAEDCECIEGYLGAHGGPCGKDCPAGWAHGEHNQQCFRCQTSSYKPGEGKTACTPCPAHSSHILRNQTSVEACVCEAGYLWNADAEKCDACASGTFNNAAGDTTCFECDVAGPAATECANILVVPPGYQQTSDGENLERCPHGDFNTGGGAGQHARCTVCPAGSTMDVATDAAARVSIAACVCDAGFSRPSATVACEACPVASYKKEAGSAACTLCDAAGTESTTDHASTHHGSCLCRPGFFVTIAGCTQCASGAEKHVLSNAACIACGPNARLDPAGTHEIDSCRCDPGYTRNSGLCVSCVSGKYKASPGDGPCSACALHANTTRRASTNISDCVCELPLWENGDNKGPGAGFACRSACDAGYTKGVSGCDPCEPGMFKDSKGPQECTFCTSPANASKSGTVLGADCTCRAGEMGVAASEYAAVTVGDYTEPVETLCAGQACSETTAGVFRSFRFTGADSLTAWLGHGDARIVVFRCEHDCPDFADVDVVLSTPSTAFHAELTVQPVDKLQALTLYTQRVTAPAALGGVALAAFAVAERLATGDAVFAGAPARTRERCAPCPRGLECD